MFLNKKGVKKLAIHKKDYFVRVRNMINGKKIPRNKAAEAIVSSIRTLIDNEICSVDEFLVLIDLDQKEYWKYVSGEIARKIEILIRDRKIDQNKIKPWLTCQDYRARFKEISDMAEWRQLHAALDSINKSVSRRFENYQECNGLEQDLAPAPKLRAS